MLLWRHLADDHHHEYDDDFYDDNRAAVRNLQLLLQFVQSVDSDRRG